MRDATAKKRRLEPMPFDVHRTSFHFKFLQFLIIFPYMGYHDRLVPCCKVYPLTGQRAMEMEMQAADSGSEMGIIAPASRLNHDCH